MRLISLSVQSLFLLSLFWKKWAVLAFYLSINHHIFSSFLFLLLIAYIKRDDYKIVNASVDVCVVYIQHLFIYLPYHLSIALHNRKLIFVGIGTILGNIVKRYSKSREIWVEAGKVILNRLRFHCFLHPKPSIRDLVTRLKSPI